jgi:hypothetical protein
VGQPDAKRLGGEAEKIPVGIEAERPARRERREAGLVAPEYKALGHAAVTTEDDVESTPSESRDLNDLSHARWGEPYQPGAWLDVFERDHCLYEVRLR